MVGGRHGLSDEVVRGYVRRTLHRLSWIRESIAAPQSLSAEDGTLADVVFHLHRLHGSAGSFGFDEVSTLVGGLEEEANACLEGGRVPEPETLRRWHGTLTDIRRLLIADRAECRAGAAASLVPIPELDHRSDVLIVDDDADILELLAGRLEREGLSVRRATTATEARAAIIDRIPDVLVIDVNLPDGSGLDIVAELREQPHGQHVPTLMMSARAAFPDRVEAVRCGAEGFFEKPIDWNVLVARVQQAAARDAARTSRILLVDDDSDHILFVRSILEPTGIEVHGCDDPARFEAALAQVRPDLVLLDLRLPGMNGFDLARFLRQDPRFAALPIVFLTADSTPDVHIQTMRAGADDYLTKPVNPALLTAAVTSRIERARALRTQLSLDGLTMLLNHRAFMERSRADFMRLTRTATPAAMVMLDLDDFKTINDVRGHATGDRVLASLAALLRRRFRASDLVGRVGGEEFALVLEGVDVVDAQQLLNRLRGSSRRSATKMRAARRSARPSAPASRCSTAGCRTPARGGRPPIARSIAPRRRGRIGSRSTAEGQRGGRSDRVHPRSSSRKLSNWRARSVAVAKATS
jgi:diguanylate cyclase (GGDEF)-like protein